MIFKKIKMKKWSGKIRAKFLENAENATNNFRKFIAKKRLSHAISEFRDEMLEWEAFYGILLLSGAIASFGLLKGNEAVVIGAMIITPLVLPLVGISLGIVARDFSLFWSSLFRVFLGVAILFGIAVLVGHFSGNENPRTASFFLRAAPIDIFDVAIAISAGAVAAISLASARQYSRFSGAAIALSLAPPISVAGIDFAAGKSEIFWNSTALFAVNAAGILGMSFFIFLLFGFRKKSEE